MRRKDCLRLVSLGVVTLFAGVLALDASHYAFVRHERCPEHQEVVHGHGPGLAEHGLDPGVDNHHRSEAEGLRAASPAEAGHEHDVCVLALFVDPESGDLSASNGSHHDADPWAGVIPLGPTGAMSPLPLLFLAPKTSPPTA